MSTTARHISRRTISATHRMHNRHARRAAVLRFQRVWSARIERHAEALIVFAAVAGSIAFVVVGIAARMYQEGIL